jgi:hypothetical protein
VVAEYREDAERHIHVRKADLAGREGAAEIADGEHITVIQVGNVLRRSVF